MLNEGVFLDEIRRCNRCGFCQETCPTYFHSKNEAQVARGRIRLIRLIHEGAQDWGDDPELTQILRSCLLCKACVTTCPSSVKVDELVIKAREKMTEANGISVFDKVLYRGMLSRRERLAKVMPLVRFYNGSGARWLANNMRITSLFKKLGYLESHLPDGLKKNARSNVKNLLQEVENPKFRVGYFLGCATDNFFSDIAKAAILYLQHLGCEVIVPEVSCCGGPHRSSGDIEEARRLAKINMDLFEQENCDFIVNDCATCAAALKDYSLIFETEAEQKQAKEFAEKVMDLNDFIIQYLPLPELKPLSKKVTYHDPCHSVRGLKIKEEPRALLKSIPGLEFVEMKNSDWCCGGAGSYFITQSETSSKILADKTKYFEDTGATILATSCPSCNMQLAAGLRQGKNPGAVMHPVQLLAASAGIIEI